MLLKLNALNSGIYICGFMVVKIEIKLKKTTTTKNPRQTRKVKLK